MFCVTIKACLLFYILYLPPSQSGEICYAHLLKDFHCSGY